MSENSSKYGIGKLQLAMLVALGVILIGLNIFLLKQNQDLKRINKQLRISSEVSVGTKLLPLPAITELGRETTLEPSDTQKTLLLIYASTCRYCSENASKWEELVNKAKSNSIRVIAVSLFSKDAEAFVEKHPFMKSIPIVSQAENGEANFKFARTPQTILVSATGEVEKVWNGLLDEKSLQEINGTLGEEAKRLN